MEELDGIAVRRQSREEPTEEEEDQYKEQALGEAVGEAAGRAQEPRAGAEKSGHAATGVVTPEKGEKKGSATCVSAGCAVMVQVSRLLFISSPFCCFMFCALCFWLYAALKVSWSIRRRGVELFFLLSLLSSSLFSRPLSSLLSAAVFYLSLHEALSS